MRYRRRETVEAFQYDGGLMNSNGEWYVPEWAVQAYKNGTLFYETATLYANITTAIVEVKVGNYIVNGQDGLVYPLSAAIFERLYESDKEEW